MLIKKNNNHMHPITFYSLQNGPPTHVCIGVGDGIDNTYVCVLFKAINASVLNESVADGNHMSITKWTRQNIMLRSREQYLSSSIPPAV